jgi:colanic acid/amylovoran biosynthesis glycosyltransferase
MRQSGIRHLHGHFATPAATVALLVRQVFGFQFSMTVHGPDEFYEINEYHLREKIEAASFICAISQYCRSQLMKLSDPRDWGKLELSRLGVDAEAFSGKAGKRQGEVFQILCLGRLTPAKGQAVLLDAVRLLQDEGRQVQATIAGDGPDGPRLRKRAVGLGVEDRCRFPGAVNPSRIQALYQAADVFVLPSFAEGIPVVLMEAMAMGVPCVSTTVNGIPELIESGRQGILVPPSEAKALAGAIARLMDDPAYRAELAAEARKKVRQDYGLAQNADRLAAIFHARLREAAEGNAL